MDTIRNAHSTVGYKLKKKVQFTEAAKLSMEEFLIKTSKMTKCYIKFFIFFKRLREFTLLYLNKNGHVLNYFSINGICSKNETNDGAVNLKAWAK